MELFEELGDIRRRLVVIRILVWPGISDIVILEICE